MSQIGPALPPHLMKKFENNREDSDSSEDDCYGPALPPHLKEKKCDEDASTSRVEKIMLPDRPVDEPSESDSSDGEIIGPSLPNAVASTYNSAAELERRSLNMKRKLKGEDDITDKNPTREEWMIELPELVNKNFGLGPRTFNRTEKPKITGRDDWTSTPQSQNEKPQEEEEDEEEMRKYYLEQERNKELEKLVKKHNKTKKRDKSLLSSHQKELKKRKKEEDSQPKVRKAFDRDEDLKLNKLDDAKKKALIKKSQELNSKFKVGRQRFL